MSNFQFLKQKIGDRNLIRQYNEGDIDTIIQIWLAPLFLYSGIAGMYQHSQSEGAAWHRR